jgi:LSD1 subclass zinc finger protein
MDRILIPCKQCRRPLSALPTMKTRKCAACGATTTISAFQREKLVASSDAPAIAASRAKKMQVEPGKSTVVKRRVAKPVTDEGDGT